MQPQRTTRLTRSVKANPRLILGAHISECSSFTETETTRSPSSWRYSLRQQMVILRALLASMNNSGGTISGTGHQVIAADAPLGPSRWERLQRLGGSNRLELRKDVAIISV